MWTLHTTNTDHWVPIKTVSSFKRMRDHAVKGHEFILRALKTSTELEVDDKGENVRRATELQKPKDQFERSVYAVRAFLSEISFEGVPTGLAFSMEQKGFGKEEPGLQQKMEVFFGTYGMVNAVRMRRVDGKKEFKVCLICYHM